MARTKKENSTESNMKVLHQSEKFDRDRGFTAKVVLFNNKRFKICADLRNGVSYLSVYIMNGDGEFKHILNKLEVGFDYSVSYVSDPISKKTDILKGISMAESVIKKIYE